MVTKINTYEGNETSQHALSINCSCSRLTIHVPSADCSSACFYEMYMEVEHSSSLFLCLSLESERSTDLVGGLAEVLRVEGSTETESGTSSELDVVCKSCDTAVVDLGLHIRQLGNKVICDIPTFAKELGSSLYFVANSRPTLLPALLSHVAFAPASTSVLTLW
jgi:hypothetical protein